MPSNHSDILLSTINASYIHASIGLRYLYANLNELQSKANILEFTSHLRPADIVEKMLTGRIRKYLAEITLLGQSFVKDPDKTVETLLSDAGATVNTFVRYEVGEGIEKKVENFADEVMAQVNG